MNKINFHLTNSCNYRCAYCFGKFPGQQELTIEQAYRVIDNIYNYFERSGITDGCINLAGGEPLAYPHLDELIDYINAYGIKISIITNGSLLNEQIIAGWKGKVDCIGLSIDSVSDETNVKAGRCHNGKTLTLKQAIRLAQSIHRNGIKLKVNTVVSALNKNENLNEVYKRLKPDRLKLLQVAVVEDINDRAGKLQVSAKEFDAFCRRHKKCAREVVCEACGDMENSYLMINPQGEVQLNDGGRYATFGNCLNSGLYEIMQTVPLDLKKYGKRYGRKADSKVTGGAKNGKPLCICGGHEGWLKVMKENLPDAEFLNGGARCAEILRNAGEVWVQSNAISHSFYWKVLDITREHNIPLHYFGFASHKKCLKQLASGG